MAKKPKSPYTSLLSSATIDFNDYVIDTVAIINTVVDVVDITMIVDVINIIADIVAIIDIVDID
jgi:hypothetical protein